MALIGGNFFHNVAYPIAFGDRFVAVTTNRVTGAALVDVYRWDRERDRLVVEILHGLPLPGAPPITVVPAAGVGAVRLDVFGDDPSLIGYLSGGDNSISILISRDRIEISQGDEPMFEILSNAIIGSPIGIRIMQGGGIGIGTRLPGGFPDRRLFEDVTVSIAELAGLPPVIRRTDFERCRLLGPAIVATFTDLTVSTSRLPSGHFLWELPVTEGVPVGAIGLLDCSISDCDLEGIGLAVAPGTRDEVLRRIAHRNR